METDADRIKIGTFRTLVAEELSREELIDRLCEYYERIKVLEDVVFRRQLKKTPPSDIRKSFGEHVYGVFPNESCEIHFQCQCDF